MLGTAGEAAYHRGDHATAERLARAGLERVTDDATSWYCLVPLAVVALARGAYAEAVEHCLAAGERGDPAWTRRWASPRSPRPTPATSTGRGSCTRGVARTRCRPRCGRGATTWPARSRASPGTPRRPKRHYRRAIDLARGSGATFLVGVATVGLLAVRGNTGRVAEALRGYRDVVDYFARTGNWTHLWPTLRNLADLLRRIGDPDPAAVLDAAADQAPDAPAAPTVPGHRCRRPRPRAATDVLTVARNAIERNSDGWRADQRPGRGDRRPAPPPRTTPRRPTPCSRSTPSVAISPAVCVACAASARTLRTAMSRGSTRSTASRSAG